MKYPECIHLAPSALVVPSMFIWHLFRPGYKVDRIPLAESVSRKKKHTKHQNKYTPENERLEPKNYSIEKEIHLPNLHFWVQIVHFPWCFPKQTSTKTLRAGRDTTSTTRNQHSGSTQWVFTLRGSMVDTSNLVKH